MAIRHDFLIVGAGLYGAVMAERLRSIGANVLIIEKRDHIGGNCYSYDVDNINIHKYGAHIFHTENPQLWEYVQRFGAFRQFQQKSMTTYKGKVYSLPINLKTINDFLKFNLNPVEAKEYLESVRIKIDNPANLEEYAISQIGVDLYEAFIKGYTSKQWGVDPKLLPADTIKRLPVRCNYNDSYYSEDHIYQGIPYVGWGQWFENLLNGIPVLSNQDYFSDKRYFDSISDRVIYTGPIDKYFDCCYGALSWRSLKFDLTEYPVDDYQGISAMFHADIDTPYTRAIEYKHFHPERKYKKDKTIVVREYPYSDNGDPFYPVNSESDKTTLSKYLKLVEIKKHVIFGGRLAEYKYYDMNTIIEKVFSNYKQLLFK